MQWKLHEWIKMEGDGNGGGSNGAAGGSGEAGGQGGSGSGDGSGGAGSGAAGSGREDGQAGGSSGQPGAVDWRAQHISDEHLRGAPALKDIPDVETLVKNHVELQSHLGNSIRIPSAEAGPDDRKAFYQRLIEKVPGLMVKPNADDSEAMEVLFQQLGRPAEATQYKVPDIDTKGIKLDHTATEAFRGIAFRHGLTQKQFEGIVKEMTSANVQSALASNDQHVAALQELRGEWGLAFDDNKQAALNLAKQTGAPDELVNAIKADGVTPATLKWLHKLHVSMGPEGTNLTRDSSTGQGNLTPSEAKERISEIMNNKQHPYWSVSDPGHNDAVKRMVQLQRFARGTK